MEQVEVAVAEQEHLTLTETLLSPLISLPIIPVSVTYQGQSAKSKEILLEEGQRLDGLTLTLSGDPQQPPKHQT